MSIPAATHFPELDDAQLIHAWGDAMPPDLRVILSAEFHRRGLPLPALPPGAEEDLALPSGRLLWWSWMKGYGLFAPSLLLSASPSMLGLRFNALWFLVFGAAGFLLAVWWLLKTQSRPVPWGQVGTIASFMILHTLLTGALGAFVVVMGWLGTRGVL